MTKTPDVYIGETRPWPDTVNVIRGKTDEVRRYLPEELGTRALLDGAKLMGENRRLRESNDKLRELVTGLYKCWVNEGCEGCPMQDDGGWCVRDIRLREMGVEVDG